MKRNKIFRIIKDKTNALHVLVTMCDKSNCIAHPEVGMIVTKDFIFNQLNPKNRI